MKKTNKHNFIEIISFILFSLVVISSILVVNIYARYTFNERNENESNVASFDIDVDVLDSNTLTQILDYEMNPGSIILLDVNLNGDNNDVKVKYKITVTTLNNLPLEITHNGSNIKTTGITGEINPHDSISISDIQIEWVESIENNNYKYSGEIDLITVTIEIEQVE